MLPDLPLLHGLPIIQFNWTAFNVVLDDLLGFAMNTLGVMEKDTVVHLAIQVSSSTFPSFDFSPQLWQEKCPYGLEDKNTNLGRFNVKTNFGGHWYFLCPESSLFTQEHDWCVPSFDPTKVPKHLWWTLLQVDIKTITITGGYQDKQTCYIWFSNGSDWSGQWSPPCTAPPPMTRWWCRPTSSWTQAKKTFILGNKSQITNIKCLNVPSTVPHRGSLTRVGSSLVAGFSFLPIFLWVQPPYFSRCRM